MDLKNLLKTAHQIMDDAQIDHALIGGIALGARGVQRFTNDIDFLVSGEDRVAIKSAFIRRGYSVYFESEEVMQLEGPGNIDFLFANRALSKTMLRLAAPLTSVDIKCVSSEALIGLKIQAYVNNPKREFRDKADIQALIESNESLNWDEIKQYADLFQQWMVIAEIRKKAGR